MLRYSSSLASNVDNQSEIGSGTEEEVELRACSVYAVEKMRELISKKCGKQVRLACHCLLWFPLFFSFTFNLLECNVYG